MAGDPSGWDEARERSREEVRRIFAPRERTCPACGHTTAASGRSCPECGASLVVTEAVRSWRRPLAAGVVLGVLALSAVLVTSGADEAARQSRLPQRHGADANRARQEREPILSAPGPAPPPSASAAEAREARRELVAAAEQAITRDARARERRGELDGPIRRTICEDATGAGDPTKDLDLRDGVFVCVAVTSFNTAPDTGRARIAYIGHRFRALLDFERSRIRWQRVFPNSGV